MRAMWCCGSCSVPEQMVQPAAIQRLRRSGYGAALRPRSTCSDRQSLRDGGSRPRLTGSDRHSLHSTGRCRSGERSCLLPPLVRPRPASAVANGAGCCPRLTGSDRHSLHSTAGRQAAGSRCAAAARGSKSRPLAARASQLHSSVATASCKQREQGAKLKRTDIDGHGADSRAQHTAQSALAPNAVRLAVYAMRCCGSSCSVPEQMVHPAAMQWL